MLKPDSLQPFVTVDVVLLTLKGEELHTALVLRNREPQAGVWTLPGGWVHPEEDQDALDAAVRILRTKAGLKSPYLEQLHTFSGAHRDSRGWSVSIVYYALIPAALADHAAVDRLKWTSVENLRTLPFDHLKMLEMALSRVRSKTLYSSLPVHLMPETFSLSELQHVYEALLGAPLDKRSFRRRIEELGVVEEIKGAYGSPGAHRPAQLYRVKRHATGGLALAGSNLGVKP